MNLYRQFLTVLCVGLFVSHTSAQLSTGRVITPDGIPVSYVNVGIVGKNVGTVTDPDGNFSLELQDKFDDDSIRFSIVGYTSATRSVRSFRDDTSKTIMLYPQTYSLSEVKVSSRKFRKTTIGYPVPGTDLRSGFSENELGSELGVRLSTNKPVLLRNLNLNIGICTYDSVTYRMNIYKALSDDLFENVLMKPVYIRFGGVDTSRPVVIDISDQLIEVNGDFLVTLELYKDLGVGKLLFNTQYFTGITYHRKVSQGTWTKSPGAVGIYINGLIIRD
ncbi:MAG TPA: carboxypeptidase-like regulatory domain-containing protein [Bacteroidales bacterium]|nr:carboxypeptidase-like regulatory domain-containing protein [Bacteroidales bacterium]